MPKVSMIMSAFRRNHGDKSCPNMLRRALDSILGQSFRDFELVLIDDGSTDGTEQVCREYEKLDSRIRLYRFEKNSGLPAKRYNDGLRLAQADYFMFMFDDDTLFPTAVQDLYSAITTTHKGCGMVYGSADTVNSLSGAVTKRFAGEWSMSAIRQNNFLCNFAVIVKREAIDAVGGYDENPLFKRLCDWDLWLRIGEEFPVSRIDKTIGVWNYNQPDSVGVTVSMTDQEKEQMRVIQRTARRVRLTGKMDRRFRFCFVHNSCNAALIRWSIGYLSEALKRDGIDADIFNVGTKQGRDACDDADAVLFYRTHEVESLDFVRRLQVKGKFLLYAIDDYIFQPGCKYSPNLGRFITPFFDAVDVFVSPNSKLLEKIPQAKPKILRRNVLDKDTFDRLNPVQFVSSASSCYAIGWLVGLGRREMNAFSREILQCLDKKLGDGERVVFTCFGQHGLGSFEKIRVVEHPYFKPDEWKELYQACRSLAFSVVINPLDEKDEFCHCKSELKYVESGAMMVPLVTSRVHPFTEVIREGENGFFASTPEEFADKALMVCRNPSLAEKVATAAQKHVKEEYDSVRNARKFMADVMVSMAAEEDDEALFLRQEANKLVDALGNLERFDQEVVGPVKGGSPIEMTVLLLPMCEISGVSVLGATYCKTVKRGAVFQVWLNGRKLREGGVSPTVMLDNAWWKIAFSPLMVGMGDSLTFRLSNCDTEVNLGFYACKDQSIGRARIKSDKVRAIAMKLEAKVGP